MNDSPPRPKPKPRRPGEGRGPTHLASSRHPLCNPQVRLDPGLRRGDGNLWCECEPHHLPPASSIALSKARFEAVRLPPALRGTDGSPAAARRRAMSCPNASNDTASRFAGEAALGDSGEDFEAMVSGAFVADALLKLDAIRIGEKRAHLILSLGVFAPVTVTPAHRILAHCREQAKRRLELGPIGGERSHRRQPSARGRGSKVG